MTKSFTIIFQGTTLDVPKVSLFTLFQHQRGLFDATRYDIESSVPPEIFEAL
jgi:hypothetical protein